MWLLVTYSNYFEIVSTVNSNQAYFRYVSVKTVIDYIRIYTL